MNKIAQILLFEDRNSTKLRAEEEFDNLWIAFPFPLSFNILLSHANSVCSKSLGKQSPGVIKH